MSKDLDVTASEQISLASRGYKIMAKLGHGTYATVFLVDYKDAKTNKEFKLACKSMDVSRMAEEFVNKFLPRELQILSKISHPNIIQIQSIFQRRTKFYVFMRYAENGDLLDFVVKKGALSEAQARVWFRQIVLAVHYLHEMEIAHRDLKCENVFITANYNIRLADFGFARYSVDSQGNRITSDTYCGSVSYAAPEILRGLPYYPKVSDMWSVGVILYVMLNKSMPFDDQNVRRLYEQQMSKKWRFRPKVINILSSECKSVASRLLEPDASKRITAEQAACSDWIAMDKRLNTLSEAEENALKQARAEKMKIYEKRSSISACIKNIISQKQSPEPRSESLGLRTSDSVREIKAADDISTKRSTEDTKSVINSTSNDS